MNVAVIGGGPAGMMAAYTAAIGGHRVTLFERNEKLGKKLYITGKGRCNVTNVADRDAFLLNVPHNPRFLYSAVSAFDCRAVMELLERTGVPLKTERGGRVFPVSDKSNDILRAMEWLVHDAGVRVRLHARVTEILTSDNVVTGVCIGGERFPAEAVVLATGGASYPQTGSTGDGYAFATALGHTVAAPHPALVPLETVEQWPFALTGLTLKNVTLTAERNGKRVYSELGELLLTHFGVSGPLVLTLSSIIADDPAGVRLTIDLKPGLTEEQLDARLLRDLAESPKKQVSTAFAKLLPSRLLPVVLAEAGIDPALPVGELSKAGRRALLSTLKALPLTVRGARSFDEAVVTRGGVAVREIQPATMASKLVQGLYFAGEVIDVDGKTGGFNLQIAWSTGAAAGRSIACT